MRIAMTGLAVLYAVVVGWNGSPSTEVAPLRFADDDAVEYARLFRDAGAHTTLLTTLDSDSRALHSDARVDGAPTLDNLLAALARADAQMDKDGAAGDLYLVYSGHGDVDHGEGFVQLDGGRLTRGLLSDRVLKGRKARRIHVIVDACKSYFLVFSRGGERRRHEAPFFVDEQATDRFPNVGFSLSTSSDGDSHEWEAFQGGVFSHEVRSALRGAADADGDGAISYAELGAFVRTANAAIRNPRFRPRYTVVPPRGGTLGPGAPIFEWPSIASTSTAASPARALLLDVPAVGHLSIEDAAGRRLADANPGTAATLHLPAEGPLFVLAHASDREYAVPLPSSAAPPVRLSALEARPRRTAARGALHEAFAQLFFAPFDRAAVDAWMAAPDRLADAAPDGEAPDSRRPLRIALASTFAATLAAGVGCTVGAAVTRSAADGGSHEARAAANDRIGGLNTAAITLYAASGAAALGWAILKWWPARNHSSNTASPRFSLAPGPGAIGLSVSAPLP